MIEVESGLESEEGKFNAGLDTLQRISEILKDIKKISIEGVLDIESGLSTGKAQHIKVEMVWQLFINAIPLLKPTAIGELRTKINAIKPRGARTSDGAIVPAYDETTELQIRNFLLDIQTTLQQHGNYFMPKKVEAMF